MLLNTRNIRLDWPISKLCVCTLRAFQEATHQRCSIVSTITLQYGLKTSKNEPYCSCNTVQYRQTYHTYKDWNTLIDRTVLNTLLSVLGLTLRFQSARSVPFFFSCPACEKLGRRVEQNKAKRIKASTLRSHAVRARFTRTWRSEGRLHGRAEPIRGIWTRRAELRYKSPLDACEERAGK